MAAGGTFGAAAPNAPAATSHQGAGCG